MHNDLAHIGHTLASFLLVFPSPLGLTEDYREAGFASSPPRENPLANKRRRWDKDSLALKGTKMGGS